MEINFIIAIVIGIVAISYMALEKKTNIQTLIYHFFIGASFFYFVSKEYYFAGFIILIMSMTNTLLFKKNSPKKVIKENYLNVRKYILILSVMTALGIISYKVLLVSDSSNINLVTNDAYKLVEKALYLVLFVVLVFIVEMYERKKWK